MRATLHLEKLWIRDVTITTGLVDTVTTPMLLRLIEGGRLDPTLFATHRFALDETEAAYDVFANAAATHALKVVLSAQPVALPAAAGDRKRGRDDGMTLVWFVVWLVANLIGDEEPLTFDPVNGWAGALLLALALDLARQHAPELGSGRGGRRRKLWVVVIALRPAPSRRSA